MRFLTDENVAVSVMKKLRNKGYDVKDVKEENLSGFDDEKILSIANKEDRIIITHDRNFANLLNNPYKEHKGVIFLRFGDQSPQNAATKLAEFLDSIDEDKIKNKIAIITDNFILIF